jgi:eukaryotic-like serine/threonine-protein kinase
MVTGHLPFQGSNPAAIVIAHLQQAPPNPRRLAPDLPDHVAGAILRGLAKSPDDRFATAGAFAQALA